MGKDLTQKSKYLALLLRHKPENAGITLDREGWALISEMTDPRKGGFKLHELNEIVMSDGKKRYEISADNEKIRAVQGHSKGVADHIVLEKLIPREQLYHGTKEDVLPLILKKGLLPMNRQHVHLTTDKKTAQQTADRRKGKSVILRIDIYSMVADDIKFYRAENGVWLCDEVPAKYIKIEKE